MQPVIESNEEYEDESEDEDQEGRDRNDDTADFVDSYTTPNQPNSKVIGPQKLSNRTLHYQDRWYRQYPWLHYNAQAKGILCFYCVKTYTIQKSALSKRAEPAFSLTGFSNWKNAVTRFRHHELSQSHQHAVTVLSQKGREVNALLCSAVAKQQQEAQHCLRKVVGSVMLLARQGLAIRGHDLKDGNLFQLLKFQAKDDARLSHWLSQCQDYTSPQIQNEILQLVSNSVVRDIAKSIRSLPVLQYSLIIDGTQDISGAEQESICLRFVDNDLVPQEVFFGLYQVPGTTGVEIARAAIDVLQRLNIPVSCLRGQTYDGAANMSGKYSGVQAELKKMQPLGLFVHCGAHCLNLITEAACQASPVVRDALQWVHELGTLSKQSGKFKSVFVAAVSNAQGSSVSLRPLCPTRWTVRGKAITTVLSQYESVLSSLEQMATSSAKANGLLERFQQGRTVLGLLLATLVIDDLECLNKSLQKRTETIAGMRAAIGCVRSSLAQKRKDEKFQEIFEEASQKVDALGLEEIKMPHQRRPPKRYCSGGSQHYPKTAEEHYRAEFFSMLDTVDVQFQERFSQNDLDVLQKLESVLLTGDVVDGTVEQYPEFSGHNLKVQLHMFHSKYTCTSVDEVVAVLRGMPTEVRQLFDQVETLVRLLLVMPVSSAEAERSFSALRRLKTWLRSTMTQVRLNSAAVCHVHQTKLDNVNIKDICQQFVEVSDRRRKVFGTFK